MRYTRAAVESFVKQALAGPASFTMRTPDEARRLRFALYNATKNVRRFSIHVRGCIVECKPHVNLEEFDLDQ